MRITKILNNNAVIVSDGKQEKIAIGAGVAFNKKKKDIVNPTKIEKLFVVKENEKLQELIMRIPEEHLLTSEEIIAYAEQQLGTKLNEHILLALTDHLSFAIERTKEGIHLQNKLLQEIKIMYREEFNIGLWAINHVKDKLHIELPIDEAAFIALHVHTMKIKGGDLHETVRQTAIVKDMIEAIQHDLDITFDENTLAFERLMTHLRFALNRVNHCEAHSLDEEMLAMIKKKFKRSYRCSVNVAKKIAANHGIELPPEELGYITLHIERLKKYQ
ncbi:PRD domain-containing protein [Virgibacillus pantothenticus]|uniref:PRD domain-containing protein n=1 Tax=Virgibacillus pantothenticus TaxID=1473 RepID=UPI0009861EAF|nr:PRD domain-containing protein [Virgibacillus pantothenticus]